MTPFRCGCSADGTTRCDRHFLVDCHVFAEGTTYSRKEMELSIEGECPPCKLARLRSVNLDSSATPTRGGGK